MENLIGAKLDIGAGADKLDGYLSVDLYAPADIQDDVTKLEKIKDNTISEIRAFHLLEHLKDSDVPLALAAMFRVLSPGGRVMIEVPDLIWLFQDFLNTPEPGRWGWKIQTIFGLQSHEGEFHRTGFSGERLGKMLVETGFSRISVDVVFSEKYNQGIIDAVGYKP
jgi:predicted SAM-dependent methyltransferase